MKKKFEQGAIGTVTAIGALILLGISVIIIPYFMGKNKQMVNAKAAEIKAPYIFKFKCISKKYEDSYCKKFMNQEEKSLSYEEYKKIKEKATTAECEIFRDIDEISRSRTINCTNTEVYKKEDLETAKSLINTYKVENLDVARCSEQGGICIQVGLFATQTDCENLGGMPIDTGLLDVCSIRRTCCKPPILNGTNQNSTAQQPTNVSGGGDSANSGQAGGGGSSIPSTFQSVTIGKLNEYCDNSGYRECDKTQNLDCKIYNEEAGIKFGKCAPFNITSSQGSSIGSDTSCSAEQKKKFWYANNNTCSLTNESYCSLDTCQKGGAEGFQGKPCYETESDCKSKNLSNVAVNTGGGAGTAGQSAATKKYYYDGTSCKETLDAFSENSACTNALQDYSSWMKDRTCFDNQFLCKQINEKNITFSELKGVCNQNNINISWKTNMNSQKYTLSIHNAKDLRWNSYYIEGEDAKKTSFSIAGFGVAGGDYEWTLQAYNLYDQPRSDATSPQKISCGSADSSTQPQSGTSTVSCPHKAQGDADCNDKIDADDILIWILQLNKRENPKPGRDARFDDKSEVAPSHFNMIRRNFLKGTPGKSW